MNYPLPKSINWMICGKCNANCPTCYGLFANRDLSLKNCLTIIKKIKNSGVSKITLTGGEPLLYKNIKKVILAASRNNLAISLHTNGLLLDDELIGFLSDIPCLRVSLALDGANNKINKKIKNVENFKDKFDDNIKKLNNLNIPISIKTMASKVNLDNLEKLGIYLKRFSIDLWSISQFHPIERAADPKVKEKHLISNEEFSRLTKNLRKIKFDFPVFFNTRDDIVNQPYFFINSEGKVFGSGTVGYIAIGDILSEEIPDLWEKIVVDKNPQKIYFKNNIAIS